MAIAKRTPGRPGDTHVPEDTARARARLAEEQSEAQRGAAGRMAMISDVAAADTESGVYDGQTGDLIESAMTVEDLQAVARRHQVIDPDEVIEPEDSKLENLGVVRPPGAPALGPLGTPIDPEGNTEADDVEQAYSTDMDENPAQELPQVVRQERKDRFVVIRVAEDIQPTIGAGSTWNFQKGKKYKVPEHVANHLNEKGLVVAYG